MSLNDRWSFFRKVKSEEEEKKNQQCNDDEVVVSMTHNTVSIAAQEQQQEQQEEQEQIDNETDVNSNSDADATATVDTNTEDMINAYLQKTCFSEARLAEEARWQKEEETQYTSNNVDARSNSNSHYKGLYTETMPTMPVLFIEEYVPVDDFKKVGKKKLCALTDWRAYIYYDSSKNVYVLNGTRRRSNENELESRYPDICMSFKSKSSLAFYLRRSTCSWKHNLSVTLYSMYRNVIHLSTPGAMPSFHSINNCRSKFRSELFGYDDCRISLKGFESYLKVLKESGDDGLLFRPMNVNKCV